MAYVFDGSAEKVALIKVEYDIILSKFGENVIHVMDVLVNSFWKYNNVFHVD